MILNNKTKNHRWDYIKQKASSQQRNNQQNEEVATEWEKMIANQILDEGLIYKIYK